MIFLKSCINQFSNNIIQLWRRLRDRLSRLRLLHASLPTQDTSASVEKVPKKVNWEATFHKRSRKVGNKSVQLTGRKTISNLKIELGKLRRIDLFLFCASVIIQRKFYVILQLKRREEHLKVFSYSNDIK